jgi:hypothetical protein
LESSLRKGVRREVPVEAMQQELRAFYALQKEVVTKRMLIVLGAILLLFLTSHISGAVLFALLLLTATEVLPAMVLPFSEPGLNRNIRRLQPVVYCSIFYSLLKWGTGAESQQIDWPMTFLALVGTSARGVVTFYDCFLQLSTRSVIAEGVSQRKTLGKLMLFPKYLIYRGIMLKDIVIHLITTVTLVAAAIASLFYYFNKLTLDCFQPNCLLLTLPIFLALQLFLDFVSFVNLTFTQDVASLSRLIKDKMPLCLSLLRLEYSPSNRLVTFPSSRCNSTAKSVFSSRSDKSIASSPLKPTNPSSTQP